MNRVANAASARPTCISGCDGNGFTSRIESLLLTWSSCQFGKVVRIGNVIESRTIATILYICVNYFKRFNRYVLRDSEDLQVTFDIQ